MADGDEVPLAPVSDLQSQYGPPPSKRTLPKDSGGDGDGSSTSGKKPDFRLRLDYEHQPVPPGPTKYDGDTEIVTDYVNRCAFCVNTKPEPLSSRLRHVTSYSDRLHSKDYYFDEEGVYHCHSKGHADIVFACSIGHTGTIALPPPLCPGCKAAPTTDARTFTWRLATRKP